MIKYIGAFKNNDLRDKRILLRADFDVPVKDNGISEDFRVKAQKETIDYLVDAGAKIIIIAHISAIDSFAPILSQLKKILNYEIILLSHDYFKDKKHKPEAGKLYLLDNIRQDPLEKQNDEKLARQLTDGFDLYVNNAFAVCHRSHASVSAVAKFLPSYGGFLIKKEVKNLSRALNEPPEGKVLILGGAKIATKLPVISNFYDKAEKILVGGAPANNFFLEVLGIDVGSSLVDRDVSINVKSEKIILPEDILIALDKTGAGPIEAMPVRNVPKGKLITDIGPESAKKFAVIIKTAKMVIWNGPMGYFEVEKFSHGTGVVAKAVAESEAESIIGGGDTVSAVDRLGLLGRFDYVSTGGGSMLKFLAGERLAGLEALGYYVD